jgi:nucleoid DNA-binding protein
MEEYLSILLENNNRVIVPEFGAFIVKNRQPLQMVFNEFLQYNDGALIDIITKKENINRDQAKNKIEQFIKEINSYLDKGEAYEIQKFGFLIKNKSGKISLEEFEKSAEDISLTKEKEIALEQEKTLSPEVPVAIKEDMQAGPIPEDQPIEKPSKKNPTEIPPTEIPPIAEKKIKRTIAGETPKKPLPDTSVKENYEVPIDDEVKTEYQTIPRNKKNIVIWVIVIVAINGAIIAYFLQNNKISDIFPKGSSSYEEYLTEDTIKTLSNEQISSDTLSIKETPTTDNQEISKPEEPNIETSIAPSGKHYYIVAGVFREEKNAQNFVAELKKKGFSSQQFAKLGSSFAVSYSVFTSRDEAEKALLKIKNEIDPGAWIKVIE